MAFRICPVFVMVTGLHINYKFIEIVVIQNFIFLISAQVTKDTKLH